VNYGQTSKNARGRFFPNCLLDLGKQIWLAIIKEKGIWEWMPLSKRSSNTCVQHHSPSALSSPVPPEELYGVAGHGIEPQAGI
jgi:hypothetical protein